MEDNLIELSKILATETDEKFIEKIFVELFTPDELHMIRQRLKIVTLLKCKIPQYEVAKKLNASLCSITRGAKELKNPESALGKIADKYFVDKVNLI